MKGTERASDRRFIPSGAASYVFSVQPAGGTTNVVPYSSSYVGHRFSGAGRHARGTHPAKAGPHTNQSHEFVDAPDFPPALAIVVARERNDAMWWKSHGWIVAAGQQQVEET